MKAVYKYPVRAGSTPLMMHPHRWLHVAEQFGQIGAWAEVDLDGEPAATELLMFGTGEQFDTTATHIGSVLMDGGTFVFHVYERGADQ